MTFKSFLNKFRHGFSGLGHSIGNFLHNQKLHIQHALSGVKHTFENVGHKISGISSNITHTASNVVQTVYSDSKAGLNKLLGVITSGQQKVSDFANNIVSTGGNIITHTEDKIGGIISLPLLLIAGGVAFMISQTSGNKIVDRI